MAQRTGPCGLRSSPFFNQCLPKPMMTIKCFVLLTMLFASPLRVFSASSPPLTNGIYVVVIASKTESITNTPFRFDNDLVWMPFHDSGEVKLLYPLDPSYLVKTRMLDPDGKEVPKTSLGKKYGSKFDQWRGFKDTRLQPISAWGSYQANPGLGGGNVLSSPKELFEMKKPGIYTMEVQLQLFQQIADTNVAWSEHLLRFPIKLQIEKPPETGKSK